MSDRVSVAVDDDGIADVRLNRPDKHNAWDIAMLEALDVVGSELVNRGSLRAVVLSGEGSSFCAGLDMALLAEIAGDRAGRGSLVSTLFAREPDSPANFMQRAVWIWTEIPVPVIAAVHGVVYGAGIQLALAADIRVVAPDARLSVMEIKWGLIPDLAGSQILSQLVSRDVAKELAFTGRVLSGVEALELGLATRLSATPRAAAFELAREIARNSPDAVRAAKRLFPQSSRTELEKGLELEAKLQRALLGGANQAEAVSAVRVGRPAKFSDPVDN